MAKHTAFQKPVRALHTAHPKQIASLQCVLWKTKTVRKLKSRPNSGKYPTVNQIHIFSFFLEIEITRATIETVFGSALLKQYPKLIRDLWDFNSKVAEFLPGLPAFTISSSVAPRDRLLEGIKKWLQATHGGTDFAKTEATDPAWDEKRGSKLNSGDSPMKK